MQAHLPRTVRDRLAFVVDLVLARWRLTMRPGLRTVGDPDSARVVVCGNGTRDVHRLERALRRSGGGRLLVLDTDGWDIPNAVALGRLTPETVVTALERDAGTLRRMSQTESAAAEAPGVDQPREGSAAEVGQGGSQQPLAGSRPSVLLILPALLQTGLDTQLIEQRFSVSVVVAPSGTRPLARFLQAGGAPTAESYQRIQEGMESAIAGASFVTEFAVIPLAALGVTKLALGLALIWGAFLLVFLVGLVLQPVSMPAMVYHIVFGALIGSAVVFAIIGMPFLALILVTFGVIAVAICMDLSYVSKSTDAEIATASKDAGFY
jgi:hypothetical protein